MMSIVGLKSTILASQSIKQGTFGRLQCNRCFYNWLSYVFNRRDESRVEKVGPDRVAAEWILRNGGSVRYLGNSQWIGSYNAIPDGPPGKYFLDGISGRNASLSNAGLDHFIGLKHVKHLDLHGSKNITDLTRLNELADSLEYLDISCCLQLSDVTHILLLSNLKTLIISRTLGKGREEVIENLKSKLPLCEVIDDNPE